MELGNYAGQAGIEGVRLLAKLEYLNPTGSVKDRAALRMILDAEADGSLKPGAAVIEPTSGNTGIGLAAIAAVRGYRVILTMPETMSEERRKLLAAYGADIVLTPGEEGMAGAIRKAQELKEQIPGAFIPGQFDNPSNAKAHYLTTGPEIWEDTDGRVDLFVAGVGSGGTITGVGRYLKEKAPAVRVVAVEPAGSAVLSGGKAGSARPAGDRRGLRAVGAGYRDLRRGDPGMGRGCLRRRAQAGGAGGDPGRHLLGRGPARGADPRRASGKSGKDDRGAASGLRGPVPVHTAFLIPGLPFSRRPER